MKNYILILLIIFASCSPRTYENITPEQKQIAQQRKKERKVIFNTIVLWNLSMMLIFWEPRSNHN